MIKIFVIVLNYNGLENTLECLESLDNIVSMRNLHIEVVVVDNNSKMSPAEKVHSTFPKVTVLESKTNDGYSGGNNRGIEYALTHGAEYVVLLNNDAIVEKHCIAELYKGFYSDENVGITVPKIYFYKGYEYHKSRYKKNELGKVLWYAGGILDWKNLILSHRGVDEVDHGQFDRVGETEFATGGCWMIKREVFEKVGLLDEKYFLYYEDSDFNEKVKRAGYKIVFMPEAIVWHKNAGSTGGSGSSLQDYFISRNRMLFGMRYASLRTKLALIKESLSLLSKGRKWQKKGIQDFYLGKFGKGSFKLD